MPAAGVRPHPSPPPEGEGIYGVFPAVFDHFGAGPRLTILVRMGPMPMVMPARITPAPMCREL